MEGLGILLPVLAILVAAIGVILLYLWWTSGDDTALQGDDRFDMASIEGQRPAEDSAASGDDLTVGQVVDDVREALSGMFSSLRESREAQRAAKEERAAADPVSAVPTGIPSPASSGALPAVSPPAPAQPAQAYSGAVEVMRLLRDLSDGSLVVEINGRRFTDISQMTDPQVLRRFVGNARALADFADLEGIEVPEVPPEPAPVPPPPAPSAPAAPVADDAGWQSTGSSSATSSITDGSLSMAQQIEVVLQRRLFNTPELSHRSIHIHEGGPGGVRIEVDGQFYQGVGDILDYEVQAFIRSVIEEWEAQQ
ncbi:MAG: hypothetical protein GYB64_06090 [Chloroflexi bacterium]|nr:hypothetical protein [Chloroflexota bacterium]